jgi:SAM-dependent methyltransferase
LNPRPSPGYIREWSNQFVNENNADLLASLRRRILHREARAIKKLKLSGRLLDVGCASGTFFENFNPCAWALFGTETSPLGAHQARNQGAEVFCGTLREANYPGQYFDVVTVLDALYYMPDPRTELAEIRRTLKDDGVLAIEIPGLTYKLLRERGPLCMLLNGKWTRGFIWSHLYHFSPSTLKLILELSGFRVAKLTLEQASLSGGQIARLMNGLHFALAKSLFRMTAGRLSIAGKEFYLAVKTGSSLVPVRSALEMV